MKIFKRQIILVSALALSIAFVAYTQTLVSPEPPDVGVYECKLIRMIDADTQRLLCDLNFGVYHELDVRLEEVNAPEVRGPDKAIGLSITQYVKDIYDSNNGNCVLVTEHKRSFTRYVGRVWVRDIDLSHALAKIPEVEVVK